MKTVPALIAPLLGLTMLVTPATASTPDATQQLDNCVSRNGGAPTAGKAGAPQYSLSGGYARDLTGGRYGPGTCLLAPRARNAYLVRGAIADIYAENGGPAGFLGFPVEDQHRGMQSFERGYISAGRAVSAKTAIATTCGNDHQSAGPLRRVGDGVVQTYGTTTCALRDGTTTAYPIRGAIWKTYQENSWLGYPVSAASKHAQQFERGRIALSDGRFRATPQFAWGLGDQIGPAMNRPIFSDVTFRTVTSWFNRPGDLSWMRGYKDTDRISDLYGDGYGNELIVWIAGVDLDHDGDKDPVEYASSQQFRDNMRELAEIFKGNGPNYGPLDVVLFTEIETYAPKDDTEAWEKLGVAYRKAYEIFHEVYPAHVQVSLGLGGYKWGDSETHDMLDIFRDEIELSDYVAVQEMNDCHKGAAYMDRQIRRSITELSQFNKPIQISHFKYWDNDYPEEGGECTYTAWNGTLDDIFIESTLSNLAAKHLVAWNFMDDHYIRDDDSWVYPKTVEKLNRFSLPPR